MRRGIDGTTVSPLIRLLKAEAEELAVRCDAGDTEYVCEAVNNNERAVIVALWWLIFQKLQRNMN